METRRGLLTLGNGKLGEGIHVWSLPAGGIYCPGASPTCEDVCYANNRGRYKFQVVQNRLQWNYEQSLLDDFSERMSAEVKKKGCLVVRVHGSGDHYSAEYASKWLTVMKACKKAKFYFYSRSWRVSDIAPVLEEMAMLKNCSAWYSLDRDTGIPDPVPPGVRLAYLQVEEGEQPELYDLRFSVRKLRKLDLPLLCPEESGDVENCGGCKKCFQ